MAYKFTHLDTSEIETTESFFSRQFIEARIHSGQESNEGFDMLLEEGRDDEWLDQNWKMVKENYLKYEEDVNQYLTLTLAELANPQNRDLLNQYLVSINADVGQMASAVEEKFKKYFLYKVNADFLLLNLGLFNPDTNLLGSAYCDKGEFYYFSAATQLKQARGGRSSLSDVLEKLSFRFGKYVEILRVMKNRADNYLSFHVRISTPDLERFQSELTQEVKKKQAPES